MEMQIPAGGMPFLTIPFTTSEAGPLGKITRRARRDGTPASDFAGFERMRRTSLPPAGVFHKLF